MEEAAAYASVYTLIIYGKMIVVHFNWQILESSSQFLTSVFRISVKKDRLPAYVELLAAWKKCSRAVRRTRDTMYDVCRLSRKVGIGRETSKTNYLQCSHMCTRNKY